LLAVPLLQHKLAEDPFPARTERWNPCKARRCSCSRGRPGRREARRLRYRDLFRPFCNRDDFVPAFVPSSRKRGNRTRAVCGGYEQAGHLGVGHGECRAITVTAAALLRQRAPYLRTVADADLVVGQAIHGQVFTELTVPKSSRVELVLPSNGMNRAGDNHRPVLPPGWRGLPCPLPSRSGVVPFTRPGDRFLPDGGVYSLALGHSTSRGDRSSPTRLNSRCSP